MILKALGVLDIITAILFILNSTDKIGWFPDRIIFIIGIILLVKGIFFIVFRDFASITDTICAVIILLSVWYSIPMLLVLIVVIFLVQKGIFSLLS